VFIWSAASIERQFAELLPAIHGALQPLVERFGTPGFQAEYDRVYPTIPVDTIDTGIMEKAPEVAMIPASFGWRDIGSWQELFEALDADEHGNVVRGQHLGLDTARTLVFGGRRLVATIGLEDLVIVETDDVLLVCRRDRAADARKLVEQLEQRGRTELL
jgi:mannose-1-phosphate guanylyltransferase